jgi:hypothetical protein
MTDRFTSLGPLPTTTRNPSKPRAGIICHTTVDVLKPVSWRLLWTTSTTTPPCRP